MTLPQTPVSTWWTTLPDGARIAVPDDLRVMTRWVLEEQGDWFEDELRFVRRWFPEGGLAIDVGANYGCYTLSLAKRAGSSGRVFAFEPGSATATMLEASVAANGFDQVEVVRSAVSDLGGSAWLRHLHSSELNELGERGDGDAGGETVSLVSLDEFAQRSAIDRLDYLKIDAEGGEVAVLRGAARLLDTTSPLLMTELVHSGTFNLGLAEALREHGLDLYRLVPGTMALIPLDDPSLSDGFQMNIFACRSDRAREMREAGHLAFLSDTHRVLPDRAGLDAWLESNGELAESPDWTAVPAAVIEAMAEHAAAMDSSLDVEERCARLRSAYEGSREASSGEPAVQASRAVIASAFGRRTEANQHLISALEAMRADPSWNRRVPSLLRGVRPMGSRPDAESLRIAILEMFERSRAWSSLFAGLFDERSFRLLAALGRLSPDIVRRLDLESRIRRG